MAPAAALAPPDVHLHAATDRPRLGELLLILVGDPFKLDLPATLNHPQAAPRPSHRPPQAPADARSCHTRYLAYAPGDQASQKTPPPTHRARTEPPDASPPDATPRPSPQARSHEPSTADSHPPAARTPRTRPRPAKPPQNPDPQPCELNTPSFT